GDAEPSTRSTSAPEAIIFNSVTTQSHLDAGGSGAPGSRGAPARGGRRRLARRLGRAGTLCLLSLAAFGGGAVATSLASATSQAETPYALLDQLGRVLVLLENEYVEPIDRRRLTEGAIKGMVAELDPHSSYLPPEDYGLFQADTEGRFGGIGVEVDFRDEYVMIIAPIEGSPADAAGIRSGDRIIAIDNTSVRGKSSDQLVRLMRGAPGTRVVLTVRRPGSDNRLYCTLTRRIIEVASVSGKLLDGGIGYLRIKTFQSGTHKELV